MSSAATQRDKYVQRGYLARNATVNNLARLIGVDFLLTEWSGRMFSAMDEQWLSHQFDWRKIQSMYREADRLDLAIWVEDRLSGVALATMAGEAVTLRWVEGDPRPDCPLVGRRLLIALDAAFNYTQVNGRHELRVEPINNKLINLFEADYGFASVTPRKGAPYWAKQVNK